MTDLHPHWQATDDGSGTLPVRVRIKEDPMPGACAPAQRNAVMTQVSRRPAAVVGILVATSIGLTMIFGADFSSGNRTVTVRITPDGFSPQTIEVRNGDSVTWVNDATTAQQLQSDRLCAADRHCLQTEVIAPGGSASMTFTAEFATGTYAYYSTRRQGKEGTIAVRASAEAGRGAIAQAVPQGDLESALPIDALASGDQSDDADASFSQSSTDAGNRAFATGTVGTESDDPSLSIPGADMLDTQWPDTIANGHSSFAEEEEDATTLPRTTKDIGTLIPTNPNTVGSVRAKVGQAGDATPSMDADTPHGGAPARRPMRQPSTGPELWAVLTGSFGLLFLGTRKMLRRMQS